MLEEELTSFDQSKAKKKKKKKKFGCSPPPAPNIWKLEKTFLLYKSILPLIFRIPKKCFFFSLRILIF